MVAPRRILIAGGGLGGLAAAVALRQAGMEVVVCEKGPELREIGSGLSVWPNATRALKEMGLLEATLERSAVLEGFELRSARGAVLSGVSFTRPGRPPALCIHRADLLAVLKEAVPPECVRVGHELESFEDDGAQLRARFGNGASIEGDALVGADGIRSRARELILGDGEPDYRGYHAWRGIAPVCHPGRRGMGTEFWGRGRRFGIEPMAGGRAFWYATQNSSRAALGNRLAWKDEVRQAFAGWAREVTELIEATSQDAILKHDIEDRPVLRRFGRGRATLLGDAAHLTTPNLGQGACLAIEDAVVLAGVLKGCADVERALREYESKRYKRARFVVTESRRIGWMGQFEGRLTAALRDVMLRAIPRVMNEWQHQRYFSVGL